MFNKSIVTRAAAWLPFAAQTDARIELRITWSMLYPVIVSSIAGYCMNLFDYVWIRGLPTTDMALLAIVNSSIVTFLFLLCKGYETTFVSVFSKSQKAMQGQVITQSLIFATWMGSAVVLALVLLRVPMMSFLSGGKMSSDRVLWYYTLVIGSFPLTLVNTGLSAAMRSYRDSKTPARISIACGLVNNTLDPLLVLGLFSHYPGYQLFGLVATSWLTKMLYLGLTVAQIRKRLRKEDVRLSALTFVATLQRRMFRLFLPSAVIESLALIANAILYSMVARYGVRALGGYGLGFEILTIAFILMKGLSIVFMIRLGHRMRQGESVRTTVQSAAVLGVALVAVLSSVLYLLRSPVLAVIAHDPEVVKTAISLLNYGPLFIASYLLVNLVAGCFQIIERPAYAMWLNLFFSLIVTPGAVYFEVMRQAPVVDLFAAMAIVSIVRQLIYAAIFVWLVNRLNARHRTAPVMAAGQAAS